MVLNDFKWHDVLKMDALIYVIYYHWDFTKIYDDIFT